MKVLLILVGKKSEKDDIAAAIEKRVRKSGYEAWRSRLWSDSMSELLGEFWDEETIQPETLVTLKECLLKAKAEKNGENWFAERLTELFQDSFLDVMTVVDVEDPEQILRIKETASKTDNIIPLILQTPSVSHAESGISVDFKITADPAVKILTGTIVEIIKKSAETC